MYAILRLIASCMNMVGQHTFFAEYRKIAKESAWLSDPYAFDQAVKATISILEALQPEGDPTPKRKMEVVEVVGDDPKIDLEDLFRNFGEIAARGALIDVAGAEPIEPEPSDKTTKKQKLDSRIAAGLGPLRDNIKKKG